eukprot:TRINITY_DN6678_c0_g2_i6.p1 TRINITY_DN6678_c0_g2~~TRINITY_DN6678_c0_g2_i6.p1  ORF type:complete len:158 (-),score=22.77 TRINITY_DN6678_c0_g2_i6:261-734(-)
MTEGSLAFSVCGTPEYLAPEVLARSGHNRMADWWSFGILIYEMLNGLPPFYDNNRTQMFKNIRTADLEFPDFFEPTLMDLIRLLLDRDPNARLDGNGVQAHPWFEETNWNDLYQREAIPPWIPRPCDVVEARYFDQESTPANVPMPMPNATTTPSHD